MAPSSPLADLIFTQDKIITYKNASQELNVHINTAKQLLHSFVSNPEVKTNVITTHLIAGFTKDKDHKVVLVKSEYLERAKLDFECITSDHVYSIQKSTKISPINELCIADSDVLQDRKTFCPIECGKKNVLKVVESIARPTPTPDVSKKQNVFLNSASIKMTPQESSPKIAEEKESKNEDKKPTPDKRKQKETENTKPEGTKEPARTIGSFFANSRSISKETTKTENKCEKKRPLEEDQSPKDKSENPEKKEKELKKRVSKKKTQQNKKLKVSHEEPKKRKRIMNMLDSDSDSESEDEEEEEAMEIEAPLPSPVKERDPIPTNSRKRIRKEIDRTFTDDEGFIITKKEYVYENCSEDEGEEKEEKTEEKLEEKSDKELTLERKPEPVKPKKAEPKASGAKKSKGKSSPVKNQASIRSFFFKK